MLTDGLPARDAERMRLLRSSADSLRELLDDALDFARIEAGRLELRKTVFSPKRLVAHVVDMFEPLVTAKDCIITVGFGDLPEQALADATRIRQVLVNLVGNAVKFTEAGAIAVHASFDAQRDRLEFTVSDTGIGIAPDLQQRIFRPFEQVAHAGDTAVQGVGLGLAISRDLVQAMGGTISVESAPSAGAVFRFDIPVEAAPAGAAADADAAATPAAPIVPLHVLVAEDNDITREVLRTMLERDGHTVEAVSDGRQAVDRARAEPFDAIILDYRMPVLDGAEAARALRADPQTRTIPVLALSADLFAFRREHLEASFDAVFEKPVDWEEMRRALAAVASGGIPALASRRAPTGTTDVTKVSTAGWDVRTLEAVRRGQDPLLFIRTIDEVVATIRTQLDALARAMARGDTRGAEEAHSPAGLAGTFGWHVMAQALRDLAHAATQADRIARFEHARSLAADPHAPDVSTLAHGAAASAPAGGGAVA
jgi:CheY-like chemotaxis protein